MSPLASKLLVLEPNEILDPETENQDSLYEKGHFRLWRTAKIKPRRIEH